MKLMKTETSVLGLIIAALALSTANPSLVRAAETEPLKLALPAPTLKGTPEDLPTGPITLTIDSRPGFAPFAWGYLLVLALLGYLALPLGAAPQMERR